jgi:hypothetical protein
MLLRGLLTGGAAEEGAHPRLELDNIEGLCHVVVGPVFKADNFIRILASGGKHDNRYMENSRMRMHAQDHPASAS